MVTRVVDTASEGDLFNYYDSYGIYDDNLFLVMQQPSVGTPIWTGGGDDFVRVDANSINGTGYFFYLGSGDDRVFGSSFVDVYFDQSGNDTVSLGAGNDGIRAGLGNDTYNGGAGTDSVSFQWIYGDAYHPVFNASDRQGNAPGVSVNLNLTGPQSNGIFGADTFTSIEDLYGGGGDDIFHGNSVANHLSGDFGSDYLRGREGNDLLEGGIGADTLIGDSGADKINTWNEGVASGDGANDIVKYTHISDSNFDNLDEIFQFETAASGGGDRIDLSLIDANLAIVGNQSFAYRGTGGFISSGGEVRYFLMGGSTFVLVDNDADADAEMVILVQGVDNLTAADFIL
jgi:serralysin